jgi:asparaginyl-tRNA synthetase
MEDLGDELFQTAKTLGQESSVAITGKVVEDTRQIGGFELHATDLESIKMQKTIPYPTKSMVLNF